MTIDPADDDSGMYTAPADIYDLPTFPNTDQTWRADAACKGMDTVAVFFPARGQSVAPAMAVCNRCPVAAECHTEAMVDPANSGIWGATSHRQRRATRSASNPVESLRARKPIDHGSAGGAVQHKRRGETVCEPCRLRHNEDSRRRQNHRRALARTATATHTESKAAA
jgi:WhiB family redox-sensing transcriptional regulator